MLFDHGAAVHVVVRGREQMRSDRVAHLVADARRDSRGHRRRVFRTAQSAVVLARVHAALVRGARVRIAVTGGRVVAAVAVVVVGAAGIGAAAAIVVARGVVVVVAVAVHVVVRRETSGDQTLRRQMRIEVAARR